jgi:hypothetical protein
MAVRYGFLDSVSGDRVYTSSLFSRRIGFVGSDGVLFTGGSPLKASQTSPVGMKVKVDIGSAFVQGRWFEVFSAAEEVVIAAANPTNPRIDRIVVRLDHAGRTVALAAKAGTPAPSPAPPALQRDSSVWELSLARVRVAAGATQILDADITDERFDYSVAGMSRPLSHLSGASNAAVAVRNTTNVTILHDIDTEIAWQGVDYMTENSMWTAAAPGRVYAPYPGLYLCLFRCMWAAHPTASRYAAMRRNNLDRFARDIRPGSSAYLTTNFAKALIRLDRGDYVNLRVYQPSGVSLSLLAYAEYTPRMEVIRVGD